MGLGLVRLGGKDCEFLHNSVIADVRAPLKIMTGKNPYPEILNESLVLKRIVLDTTLPDV